MTSCEHSGPLFPKPPRYRFNPYEAGVFGGDAELRAEVAEGLAMEGLGGLRAGVAAVNSGQAPGFTGCPRVVDAGGVRVTTAPPDDVAPPMPLLDADAVLINCEEPCGRVRVCLLGDGPAPKGAEADVYAARPEACPVLPPDAAFYTTADMHGLSKFVRKCLDDFVPPVVGLVLAGGTSSRMGRDKAAMDWHGVPQAAYAAKLLSAACEEVYASVRPGGDAPADVPVLEDAILGAGALGAIATALKTRPDAAWLVLACDMPFVDAATLEALLAGRNPYKLATAFRNPESDWPEPLCALYEPKAIHRLLAFFAAGYVCPRKVLINSDAWLLEPPNASALENVNRPEEAEAARRRIEGAPGGAV